MIFLLTKEKIFDKIYLEKRKGDKNE